MNSPKNNYIDAFPLKNVLVKISSFQRAATAEQVLLDFEDDYGFWKNYQCLEKEIPSSCLFKEQIKYFGEAGPQAIIEDAKGLSGDVYNLSSQKDMLNQFTQQNL